MILNKLIVACLLMMVSITTMAQKVDVYSRPIQHERDRSYDALHYLIELDVDARRLELKVDEAELDQRRQQWKQPPPKFTRGYGLLFSEHVTQAHEGCDFDFLQGGKNTAEPEIH